MKLKTLAISSILAAALIGCGGSSNSNNSDEETTNTGTFVDAPVAGISYETTSGLSGSTDNEGHFSYKDGDYVSFKLGDVNLGTTKADKTITPLNITSNDTKKAAYIAYILQNLDTDGDNTNDVIKLPDNEKLKTLLSSINLDDENNITATISDLKSKLSDYNFANVTIDEANTTMVDYLKDNGIMSVATGFTKEGLEGKTFYMIDKEEQWVTARSVTFKDGIMSIKDTSDNETSYTNAPYEIDEKGELIIKWPDAEKQDNEMVDYSKDEIINIIDIFSSIIETQSSSGEKMYITADKSSAEKLAILLNVKDTNSYKPLIDSGKTIYVDSRSGFAIKYEAYGVFNSTGAKVTFFDDEGNTKTENMTFDFNSDYTSYKEEDGDNCHIDEVNVELGYVEEQCDESTHYFFLSETEAENFVPLFLNHFNGEKIDPRTLDNKVLYKISGNNDDVFLQAMKIDGDKIALYGVNTSKLDTNAELVEAWKENNIKVSYTSDGKIDIEGTYSWDGENEDDTGTYGYVYRFNLAGQKVGETFPVIFLANENSSLEETLDDKLESFTFTKGYAYCPLLFDECYFDKNAMDEIVEHYNQ